MTGAYYNEIDPFAAAWLRELITAGHIAPGDVDTRSIEDVTPMDLRGYTQCHFFAGIGGWSYALRLAGWPDDRPVWTGSCPCQPFSAAGKGGGFADERHLWPAWYWLIGECHPVVVFGEQVASRAGLAWFGLVSADLEGAGYAVGAVDLCAAGVGAPHIRQRLWFVAESHGRRGGEQHEQFRGRTPTAGPVRLRNDAESASPACELADAECDGGWADEPGRRPAGREADGWNPWSSALWLPCRDGKARPVEPGSPPLAHGVPARVGRLRGYGNAIVPQVAAEVIRAYMEAA